MEGDAESPPLRSGVVKCRRCNDSFPAYYMTNGHCEECRQFLISFVEKRRTRAGLPNDNYGSPTREVFQQYQHEGATVRLDPMNPIKDSPPRERELARLHESLCEKLLNGVDVSEDELSQLCQLYKTTRLPITERKSEDRD